MQKSLARLRAKKVDEQGFTLIELMVVVIIIAILIAIAIPTFLGARQRAQNRAAQSNIRNAFASAKTLFTDSEDYSVATPAAMQAAEPSLVFTAGDSAVAKTVSIITPSATIVILAAKSASGNCYALRDNAGATVGAVPAGTQFATVTGACNATNAAGATWADQW